MAKIAPVMGPKEDRGVSGRPPRSPAHCANLGFEWVTLRSRTVLVILCLGESWRQYAKGPGPGQSPWKGKGE